MKAKILTTEQIRNCESRSYNPEIWDERIDSMGKYSDVVWYHVPKGDGYDYNRYYVEYTLPEGLRLFKSFGYSGSITSGGFYRLDKTAITDDGKTFVDVIVLAESGQGEAAAQLVKQLDQTKTFELSMGKFQVEGTNELVVIGTSPKARLWMIERCKHGLTFTKGF